MTPESVTPKEVHRSFDANRRLRRLCLMIVVLALFLVLLLPALDLDNAGHSTVLSVFLDTIRLLGAVALGAGLMALAIVQIIDQATTDGSQSALTTGRAPRTVEKRVTRIEATEAYLTRMNEKYPTLIDLLGKILIPLVAVVFAALAVYVTWIQ